MANYSYSAIPVNYLRWVHPAHSPDTKEMVAELRIHMLARPSLRIPTNLSKNLFVVFVLTD
jgi:hypothetical protein